MMVEAPNKRFAEISRLSNQCKTNDYSFDATVANG